MAGEKRCLAVGRTAAFAAGTPSHGRPKACTGVGAATNFRIWRSEMARSTTHCRTTEDQTVPSSRRRPTGALLGGVLALAALGVILARPGAGPTPEGDLRRRLARAEEPARFSLDHQRGGSRVLECVLVNTRLAIDVDSRAGTMAVRREDGELIAFVDPDTLLLRSDLFRDPPFTTRWLAVPRTLSPSILPALRRALGADLAGYLLAARLPATGPATAAAALEASSAVERIDPLVQAGARADGYRLRLDPDRFAAAATIPGVTSTTSTTVTPVPRIDVWVTPDGNVVRVSIRPQTDRGPGPAEDGWTVDYGPPATVPPPQLPPGETTDIGEVDSSVLAAAAVGCELGG